MNNNSKALPYPGLTTENVKTAMGASTVTVQGTYVPKDAAQSRDLRKLLVETKRNQR